MVTAIVLAAGRSTRMGGGQNKQFREVLGKPVLWFSLAAFHNCSAVNAIVLVRRPDCADEARTLVERFQLDKVVAFTEGGKERQDSVWNGLAACPAGTEVVVVHDGARPLVNAPLIEATIASAREHGTGIAATKVVDTIKEANEDRTVVRTVDRTKLWAVQTPQTVRAELLRRAYERVLAQHQIVTDEAAAVESLGLRVHLVDTPFLNLKITTPSDVAAVEALLRARHEVPRL